MKVDELAIGLALNTRLTAVEAHDAVQVLGAIIQYALQQSTEVIIPGVGEIGVHADGTPKFEAAPELLQIIANKSATVRLTGLKGLSSTDLWTAGKWVFKHNVNVC